MKKKIVIDIGHGGKDPGASGGGMKESKINWNVAMKLKELLLADGYLVVMTRNTYDQTMSLTARAKAINAAKPDLWLSDHHNAGGGDGYDVIYQTDPLYTVESKRFADLVAKEFDTINNRHRVFTKPSTSNPKEDWYTILALSDAPGIIAEAAFLDTKDVTVINTLTKQWAEAACLHRAINRYFNA